MVTEVSFLSPMFDLPLRFDRQTLYDELRVEPESLADEIRESKTELTIELEEERIALEKELKNLESAVPGLEQAKQKVKEMQTMAEQEPQLFEEAREQLAEAEVRAMRVNPKYREMLRRIQEIERRKIHINQITIDNPESRKQYDQEHPPLGIMKLEDAARDGFLENRTTITLLRRELSQFIAAHGEEVSYPSDLYREDFQTDFTRNSFLDQE